MSQFNEDNAVEQLFIETLKKNGWKYIPAEQLDRELSDVMVESMVKNALIRLNPEIEELMKLFISFVLCCNLFRQII